MKCFNGLFKMVVVCVFVVVFVLVYGVEVGDFVDELFGNVMFVFKCIDVGDYIVFW